MKLKVMKKGSDHSMEVSPENLSKILLEMASKGFGRVTIIKSEFHNPAKDFTSFFCEQLND